MKHINLGIFLLALFISTTSFTLPPTVHRTKTISFNTANNHLLKVPLEVVGAETFFYVPIKSNVGSTVNLFRFNSTSATPTIMMMQSYAFANSVQDVRITFLNTNLVLSC